MKNQGNKTRYLYLDCAKGLAILLMLLCHSAPGELVNGWIFSFHMPLFFLVGGILLRIKLMDSAMTLHSLGNKIKRRFYQLIIPYIIWGTIIALFFGALAYVSSGVFDIMPSIMVLLHFDGIASLWFIPDYLIAELLICIAAIFNGRKGVFVALLFIIFYLLVSTMGGVPVDFSHRLNHRLFLATIFFTGFLIGNRASKIPMWSALFLILSFSVLHFLWMPSSALGGWIQQFFIALFLSIGFLSLFIYIPEQSIITKGLSYFGRNSIILLCTNNVVLETIRLIDYRFFGNI